MSSGTLWSPASIVKWHRIRGLFRACYFFRERTQKKSQSGIRAFFILRAQHGIGSGHSYCLSPRWCPTEFDDRAEAKTIACLRELKATLRLC